MELYTTYQPRLKSLQGNFRPRPDLVIARSIHQGSRSEVLPSVNKWFITVKRSGDVTITNFLEFSYAFTYPFRTR